MVLLAACGSTGKLDTSKAEQLIPKTLRRSYPGTEVGTTTCKPRKVKLAAGVTFNCSTSLDGQPLVATAVQDDKHGNLRFVLDKPVVYVPQVAKDLASKFGNTASSNGTPPATPPVASCAGKKARVLAVLQSFTCTLSVEGTPVPYSVVACDAVPHLVYLPSESLTDPAKACQQSKLGSSGSPSSTSDQLPAD